MTKPPHRVLHVIDALRRGGAESLLVALVGQLTATGRCRNAVCTFSPQVADPGLVAGLRATAEVVRIVPADRLYDPRLVRGIGRLARSFEPDVIHSHLPAANVNSRIAARLLGIPHVTTVHLVPGPGAEDTGPRRRIDALTARMSRVLIAPSLQIAEAVEHVYGVPPERIRLILNAPVNWPPRPGFDRGSTRRRLLAGRAGPVVLCVARLERRKGIDDLVVAAGRLLEQLPGLRVVVAGSGTDEARLARAIVDAGLGEVVELAGDQSDIAALLACSDAFCLPSRKEGLPLSVLEAMHAALPCVVTPVGGLQELIVDGRDGLLVAVDDPVALADALRRVLTDPELSAALGAAAARRIAERHSLPLLAERYAEVYDDVTASSR